MKNIVFTFLTFTTLVCFGQKKNTPLSPKDTEIWNPIPPKVKPGVLGAAPSDAIVLFDGSDFDHWTSTSKSSDVKWLLNKDKSMTVMQQKDGHNIITKQNFGSIQLHLEWKSPNIDLRKKGQQRGNSGVFIQGRYEVQILDNNNNPTYTNGQVASVYKQSIPLANALAPTGEWNTYDIIYHAPQFKNNKELLKPASITVIHNGILAIDHFTIKGSTRYIGLPKYEAHGDAPIILQNHGSAVSFRNIWLRKL